jgi:hypothetical protein
VGIVASEAVEMGDVISDGRGQVDEEATLALRFVGCCTGRGYSCIGVPTGLQSVVLSSALTSIP